MKFKYKFQIVGDGKHGNIDKVTGEWNGMIRELQDQVRWMKIVFSEVDFYSWIAKLESRYCRNRLVHHIAKTKGC